MRYSVTRRGVTLLEVLVSVFVLTFGILGVAAMIPLGGHQIQMANIAERSSGCGRAGLHQVQVRDMLNPERWLTAYQSGGKHEFVWGVEDWRLSYPSSFAIDPLFIADGNQSALAGYFPYVSDASECTIFHLQRLTLNVTPDVDYETYWSGTNRYSSGSLQTLAMSLPVADRVFRWRDDAQFDLPADETLRPRALETWVIPASGGDSAENIATPPASWEVANLEDYQGMTGGASGQMPSAATPLLSTSMGDYSWMATVTPLLRGPMDEYGTNSQDARFSGSQMLARLDQVYGYKVAIVVFYQRQFGDLSLFVAEEPRTERMLECKDIAGWAGGDVRVIASSPGDLDMTDVKWVMLSGKDRTELDQGEYERQVWQWYRVLNSGEIDNDSDGGGGYERWLTLAGPDWRYDPGGVSGTPSDCRIVLCNNVVGVYTAMIEVQK